ncbi:MAG: hypothetical protein JWN70_6214 [Planctomycetaceae bacterium]|nr:hypothetical protein [Planctomycetaceae bacterium]
MLKGTSTHTPIESTMFIISGIATLGFVVGLLILFADGSAAFSTGMSDGSDGVRSRRGKVLASAINMSLFSPWVMACRIIASLEIAIVGLTLVSKQLGWMELGDWFHLKLGLFWLFCAFVIRGVLTYSKSPIIYWVCAMLLTVQSLSTLNALQLNGGLGLFGSLLRGNFEMEQPLFVLVPGILFWWCVLMGVRYTHGAQLRQVVSGWVLTLSAIGILRIEVDMLYFKSYRFMKDTSARFLDDTPFGLGFIEDPFFLSMPLLMAMTFPIQDASAEIYLQDIEPAGAN